MSWRHILFIVDSAGHVGPRMLRKLSHLARGLGAEVELFQPAFEWGMLNKGGLGSVASDAETHMTLEQRRRELDSLVELLLSAGVRACGVVSSEKPGYASIVRHVLDSKPDLLIVQSTRHSAIARLVLSYTDFKLIETCPCPLLLMKTEKSYLDACIVAAVDPMHAHDKPPALDEAIVDAAALLARAVGGTLHVCHALTPWADLWASMPVAERTHAELCAAYRTQAQTRVNELAPRADLRDDRIHVMWGEPTEVLSRCARTLNAEMMVMGAVSRSGIDRVFIGHTAERVLDALECDVLVIKPPGFAV